MKTRYLSLLCACLAVLANPAPAADAPAGQPPPPPEVFHKAPERPVDLVHDKNLYIVGYAHLDTQWRWAYPQVTREFIGNTLHENFALFEKYPNYIFNFSGSRRYEMMEEYFPDDFPKLKAYVAAGRWFPAGSSVDEGDSMVPSAESLVRHVLYGNRYFRRQFGIASEEFMLPDCFGFPYALPTILAHCGVKGFSTQKLTWGSAVGIPFKVGVWEGPDGRSVVAALDPGSYTGLVKEDLSRNEGWLKRITNTGAISGANVDYHYFGTGDRGGAPADDSVRWVERSIAGKGPIRVISARSDQMFKDLRPEQIAKLPRYKGELLLTQHSAGSITSQAYMKRWNRKNELLADDAERASVAAAWLGASPYPAKKLYDAWDLVLGSQMHDMLPGTSEPQAYEFCWNDEVLAANQFSAVLQQAAGAVASGLDTRGDGVSLVVFNPLSIERQDVVEATVAFAADAPAAVSVTAPDGHEVPAQVLSREGNRATIAFVATMRPLGFATFGVRPATGAAAGDGVLRVSATGLENERYRVTLAANGDVASIFDKAAGRELLAGPARLAFQYEKPEMYPAWNMDWVDQQKPPRAYVEGPAQVRIVETGPVRVALEVTREAEGSRFVQTLRLAAGGAGDRVEFLTRIDWQTGESCLKAVLPLTVANPVATYDSQVGTLERGNDNQTRYEMPQHQWFNMDAPDRSFGVAVLNDSKYGSDKPDDATLRLTLLYTPGVRGHYQDQAYQDFGRHEMLYAVASHAHDWRAAQVPWAGARLNQPLVAFQTPAHAGPLGRELSLFSVSTPQVSLEAVKKAEDGDEIIVRFQELTGQPAKGVRLASAGVIVSAREVDGQERPLGGATVKEGKLTFDLDGYGLRAFALKLKSPKAKLTAPRSQPVSLRYDDDVVSTNRNRADGRFDAQGRSYPAEQLPAKLVSEGIEFVLGPTGDGKANAVAARGQKVTLPAGDFSRLYLLAAADGDVPARFAVDDRPVDLTIQNWTGFIGQWDKREWEGEMLECGYTWFNALTGLVPGYTKRDTVAWYASHRHLPTGDDHYRYTYLFKYSIDLPPHAKTLTLPNDPRIRVFAMSVGRSTHDDVIAAQSLYDRLDDRQPDAPKLAPTGGSFDDTTFVSIRPPLYWRRGGLHYTLDGSVPTPASPVYTEPISLDRDAIVTAREFDATGQAGPTVSANFRVTDRTPPKVTGVFASATMPALRIDFSEPLEAAAAAVANYQLPEGISVTAATLAPNGRSVTLTLSAPLTAASHITVTAIRDNSPAHNSLDRQTAEVTFDKPIFERATIPAGEHPEVNVPELPVKKGQSWTMNVYVRPTAPPDNRTLIAGFGHLEGKEKGIGRYFGTFANGLHVWVRGAMELESATTLKTNQWQMLTATYDGATMRLFVDGREVSSIEGALPDDEPVVRIAPLDPWDKERRFEGEIRDFAIWNTVVPTPTLQLLATTGHKP